MFKYGLTSTGSLSILVFNNVQNSKSEGEQGRSGPPACSRDRAQAVQAARFRAYDNERHCGGCWAIARRCIPLLPIEGRTRSGLLRVDAERAREARPGRLTTGRRSQEQALDAVPHQIGTPL